ncbi:hypothetical protein [Helicobacter sp. 11S02629-2]|uniref:hypothetical protein n=1 Tax=Helicobacter sp. 11S02629-2 TaxID=1476195 RepID=UPI000BA72D59|nr:hypothetical protein [Helicobacter sp. 11S02629-2]PAF42740.1 hypothetical protein BKH40_07545 [Helicobacter sp. 11S02629-2]
MNFNHQAYNPKTQKDLSPLVRTHFSESEILIFESLSEIARYRFTRYIKMRISQCHINATPLRLLTPSEWIYKNHLLLNDVSKIASILKLDDTKSQELLAGKGDLKEVAKDLQAALKALSKTTLKEKSC